jgi:hypothetical protein
MNNSNSKKIINNIISFKMQPVRKSVAAKKKSPVRAPNPYAQ